MGRLLRNFIHFKIRIFINRGKYFEKKKKSNIQKMNNKKTHKKSQAVLAA